MTLGPTYDKYDPISGGSRARLAAALPLDAAGQFGPRAVSLNATGKLVVGTAGQSGLFGILVKNVAHGPVGPWGTDLRGGQPNAYAPIGAQAGDVVDVMHAGDIVNLDQSVFVPGSKIYAAADGTLSVTAGAGKIPVGWVVEKGRAVIRVTPGAVAGV